jgi:hypothetical protein
MDRRIKMLGYIICGVLSFFAGAFIGASVISVCVLAGSISREEERK